MRARHIPGLDGLRALSVLFVIAFHAHFALARGGFLGVTIFFVLSGFLITGLLQREQDRSGEIQLGRFYARRLFRLYPALIVLVTLSVLATFVYLNDWSGTYLSSPVALVYLSNFTAAFRDHGGLYQHTWSLSVEEQFYLLWPLALLGVARSSAPDARRRLVRFALIGAGLSYLGALASYFAGHYTFSRLTPLSASGLLVGCALALHLSTASEPALARLAAQCRRLAPFAAVILVGLLAVAAPSGPPSLRRHIVYAGAGPTAVLATAVLVAHFTTGDSRLLRALDVRPLRAMGRVSYGMYLFHILIWATLLHFAPGTHPGIVFLVTAVVAFALARVSYRFVERPALRWRDRVASTEDPAIPGSAPAPTAASLPM